MNEQEKMVFMKFMEGEVTNFEYVTSKPFEVSEDGGDLHQWTIITDINDTYRIIKYINSSGEIGYNVESDRGHWYCIGGFEIKMEE